MLTVLASYPRSGNTWLRYCIEVLTKRPTVGYLDKNRKDRKHPEAGICNVTNTGANRNSPPMLVKRHTIPKNEVSVLPLILLIRNYKECILSHGQKFNDANKGFFDKNTTSDKAGRCDYLGLIKIFDIWKNVKTIIYYEDFILRPEQELRKILNFIKADIKPHDFAQFVTDIKYHKEHSLKLYGRFSSLPKSRGDHILFHSKNISSEERRRQDNFLAEKEPKLFNMYLKRYAE